MLLQVLYLDQQKNLLLLERELTDKEIHNRTIDLSFPHKALILGYPTLDGNFIWETNQIYNAYEKYFSNFGNGTLSVVKIPFSAFREENKIFELRF
jgi:hypothetical protein